MTDSSAASLIYVRNSNSDYKLILCLSISHNHLLILFRNHHPFPSHPSLQTIVFCCVERRCRCSHVSRITAQVIRAIVAATTTLYCCGRRMTPVLIWASSDTAPPIASLSRRSQLSKKIPSILVAPTTASNEHSRTVNYGLL